MATTATEPVPGSTAAAPAAPGPGAEDAPMGDPPEPSKAGGVKARAAAPEVDDAAKIAEAPVADAPGDVVTPTSGKRERKRTVKYEAGGSADAGTRRRERRQGSGTPLGQIPNVAFGLNAGKAKDDEVVLLHRFCYGVSGAPAKRKENVRKFSGFVFAADKDRTNMRSRMSKENVTALRKVARLLDVPLASTSVHKADVVEALIAFLENPKVDKDRADLAAKAQKKKEARAKEREAKKLDGGSVKSKSKKKTKASDNTDSESGTEEEGEDEDAVESRAESKGKLAKRREKTSEPDDEAESDSGEEEEGDDDEGGSGAEREKAEPPSKKAKKGDDDGPAEDGGPSNDALREAAAKLAESSGGDQLTMREVRTQLESQFKCTLERRMAFLRTTVNKALDAKKRAAKKVAKEAADES
jgi:hypothetical protein